MPKRMIDTELWNDDKIIEMFTAEDRYFWLYLLTNPHTNICGVGKASTVVIARDMGYSKETIQNLLYRFTNIHKLIYVDNETNELLILNWGRYNWTKSGDILTTLQKKITEVKSQTIVGLLQEKFDEYEWGKNGIDNRVLTGCQQGTNTNTITNIYNKREEVFTYIWNICVRKESKEQAKKTFAKLMKECKTEEEVKQKGRTIYQNYQIACKQWQEEQREKQYIPLLSTWLNDNVPEKMIKRR